MSFIKVFVNKVNQPITTQRTKKKTLLESYGGRVPLRLPAPNTRVCVSRVEYFFRYDTRTGKEKIMSGFGYDLHASNGTPHTCK